MDVNVNPNPTDTEKHGEQCRGPIYADVRFPEMGRGKRHFGIITQCSVCHRLWEQEERAVRHISREEAEKYYDIIGKIDD
jgi:hypothetical protein